MAKIIKATDYGNRKVIGVCLNPEAPEWVHKVGEQQVGPDGKPRFDVLTGSPILITSTVAPADHTGIYPPEAGKTTCHNCHSNLQTQEYIFEGKSLGLTDAELLAEVKRRVHATTPTTAKAMAGLAGQVL